MDPVTSQFIFEPCYLPLEDETHSPHLDGHNAKVHFQVTAEEGCDIGMRDR